MVIKINRSFVDGLRLDAGISRLDDGIKLIALEDFAKLIVNECITAIHEAAEDIDNGDIFSDQELLNKFEQRWSAGLYYAIEKIEERLQNGQKRTDN